MDNSTKVKDNPSYIKGNGVCLNVNETAYQARKSQIQIEKDKNMEIEKLKMDVSDMKGTLELILQKLSN